MVRFAPTRVRLAGHAALYLEKTYQRRRTLHLRASPGKVAKLRLPACVEDTGYQVPRGLHHAVMRSLAAGNWIRAHKTTPPWPTQFMDLPNQFQYLRTAWSVLAAVAVVPRFGPKTLR